MFAKAVRFGVALSLVATPMAVVARDASPIKVSGAPAAKGVTQVAIGAFNVGFISRSVDQTAATGGLIGAFGGATKATSELVGVTPAMMQAITDTAYADFKTQLTAQGYAIAPSDALFAHPQVTAITPQPVPLDINIALEKGSKGKATYYKPSELPRLLMTPGDFVGSGFSSMGIQMSAGRSAGAMAYYARESNVSVVSVVYLIDFSNQKRPGAFSFGGIQVNSGLSVAADYSRLTMLSPTGKFTVLTVNQPVAVEGEFVEKADTTGAGSKAMETAANVAGGALAVMGLGGMRFGKTRKFEFTAKPGNYENGAAKAASLASERLVAQLAALR